MHNAFTMRSTSQDRNVSETELLLLAVGVVMTTIYCTALSRLGNKVAARNTVPVPLSPHICNRL